MVETNERTDVWKREVLIDTLKATVTAMKKENFLLPEIVNLVTRTFMSFDVKKEWDKTKGDTK